MTPALAIARSIDEAQSDQILHIDYSARTEGDLVYRQELDELAARNDNISVNYRTTVFGSKLHDSVLGTSRVSSAGSSDSRPYLDLAAVQAIHTRLPGARYLLCGPPGYMQAAQEMLLEVGVRPERVQVEIFTAVGHAPLDAMPERSVVKQLQLIVTLGLCVFYLIQSALDWGLPSLAALQQSDGYRIITGSLLIAFIGHQWYLPYLRLTAAGARLNGQSVAWLNKESAARRDKVSAAGFLIQTATSWHSYLGVLAPVLLYLHSVSLGFAYTFVLSFLFVLNAMVGAVDKTLISNFEQRQRFQRVWLLVHVPSSCLITVLALIHLVYALAYK